MTPMSKAGIAVSAIGSAIAIAFPPYSVLGQEGWGFILSPIVEAFGRGPMVYEHLDWKLFIIELIAIDAVGIALIVLGRKR